MKKRIAAAAMVALAGVLAVSGCSAGLPSTGGGQVPEATQEAAPTSAKATIAPEELSEIVDADVEKTVTSLNDECDALIAGIDSYETYKAKTDEIQAFYNKVVSETDALGIRLRQYSVNCANAVLSSDLSHGEMYDELEVIYDEIYDDAGDDLYDSIYDDLFKKLYDAFYDGVIQDAYDVVGYGEWSETLSDAYDMYTDGLSDTYESIVDCRSDVYGFCTDVRSKVFSDKLEKAQEEIDDFQEDIDKLQED